MANKQTQQKKSSRKVGRNYRWGGESRTMTKYRAKHGIGPGRRKDRKSTAK